MCKAPTRSLTFFPASGQLHAFTWSFNWFIGLSVYFLIGKSDYFKHIQLSNSSPYGYPRQPVLLLHLIFHFGVIFSYKCKSTLKVVVVVIVKNVMCSWLTIQLSHFRIFKIQIIRLLSLLPLFKRV